MTTASTTPVTMIEILQRQLQPTLQMLANAIDTCPEAAWEGDNQSPAIWQHAYHTLVSLAIWLHWPSPALVFPPFHREGRDMQVGDSPAYTRELLKGYRTQVYQQIADYFAKLTPENLTEVLTLRGKTFTRADFIVGQISHTQYHVGCMNSQLRRRTGTAPGWIGYGDES